MIRITIATWLIMNILIMGNITTLKFGILLAAVIILGLTLKDAVEPLIKVTWRDKLKTLEDKPLFGTANGVWAFVVIYFISMIFYPQYSSAEAVRSDIEFREQKECITEALDLSEDSAIVFEYSFILPKELKAAVLDMSYRVVECEEVLNIIHDEFSEVQIDVEVEPYASWFGSYVKSAQDTMANQLDRLQDLNARLTLFMIMCMFVECILFVEYMDRLKLKGKLMSTE